MEYYNVINSIYTSLITNHIVTPCFKIELLDENERAYREITQQVSIDSSGSISATYQQGVRKTISLTFFDANGEFIPDPYNQNLWIGKKFKVYLGLTTSKLSVQENPLVHKNSTSDLLLYYQMQQGIDNLNSSGVLLHSNNDVVSTDYTFWFSKGVFILTSITANRTSEQKTVSISGVDKFGRFTADTGYNEMIANYVIKANTPLYEALTTILLQDCGNGHPIDPIIPVIDPYYRDIRIPYEIQKGAGSYMGDIITELATMFRADVYYDDDGRFNFRRALLGDDSILAPTIWQIDTNSGEYLSSSIDYDLINAINTVYVVGDNPSSPIAPEAYAQNNNPASPLNVATNGIRSRLYTSSTIQTRTEAQDYAFYMLNQFSRIQQSLSLTLTFIPHLMVGSLIELTDDFYGFVREHFVIQSITFPLGLGEMTIGCSNIQELPTY